MPEWPKVELRKLVASGEISYGIVQPGQHEPSGIPIVRVADIRNGSIATLAPLKVNGEISRKYSRTSLLGGELLISLVGTVGEAAVVPSTLAGWNVARAVAVLRLNDNAAEWVRYCLLTTPIQAAISAALNTTVQATLNLGDLKRLHLPMPPRPIRDAIVDVLGALDDKIAANERVAGLADEYAKAIFVQSASELGCELASVAQVVMGSSPPGTSYNEIGNGTPFHQGVRDFGLRSPTARVWTTSPVRLAKAGDTLLSVRAPVGTVNLAPSDLCVGRGLAALRSTVGAPSTLFHQVRSAAASWAEFNSEGTVFGAINRKQLERVQIPSVDPESQLQLEAMLTGIGASLASVIDQSVVLARTRDELLPLLMSGRISVATAEREVSNVV